MLSAAGCGGEEAEMLRAAGFRKQPLIMFPCKATWIPSLHQTRCCNAASKEFLCHSESPSQYKSMIAEWLHLTPDVAALSTLTEELKCINVISVCLGLSRHSGSHAEDCESAVKVLLMELLTTVQAQVAESM